MLMRQVGGVWGQRFDVTNDNEGFCLKIMCRQLSATSDRASRFGDFDKHLSRQLREGSQTAKYDTQTLRVRKMSLDNRYI